MANLDEILKADAVPLVSISILGLALPYLLPGLRPRFAGIAKAGAKLFLEAELGADNELTDRLVDATIDALVGASSQGSEAHRTEKTQKEIDRFVSASQAAAHRRGWDAGDAEARYHRHLSKLDAAVSRTMHGAHPSQRAALVHAHQLLARHRTKPRGHGSPAIGRRPPEGRQNDAMA